MSSWITLTIELLDTEAYYADHGSSVDDDAIEAFREYADRNGLQVFSGISEAQNRRDDGTCHRYLTAVIGGTFSDSDALEMAEAVLDQSTGRVVVVHANDTSDTGHAHLYVRDDDNWTELISYDESQGDDGCHQGMKAAAHIYASHGIPVIARRNPTIRETERDDYSEHTINGRPR